jgi:hypothetical protein
LTIPIRIKRTIKMLELRKRYLELKAKAKQLMIEGNMSNYLKLMTEVEQLNLILVRVNK